MIEKFICKNKLLIIIITLLLCIPAIIGYINTKINYDILVYLPKDIETLKGEKILTDDFNMGAFSIVVVDKMSSKEILDLEEQFKNINSVEHVLSITDITGTTIPINILPTKIVKKFSSGTSQLMLVTFKNSTSDDETLNAVAKMREITDEKVKIGGMSAMVLDTKELFNKEMLLYVIIAVILCIIVLELFLDSYLIPFLLMLNIGIAILFNMGTNIFLGNISYITKAIAAVLQLGVTTDFSIFLYHKYEALKKDYKNKNEAMAIAIHDTFISVFGSSLTTIAGFLALCTMNLTLGTDIGIVMAKGVLIGVICVLTLFPALLLVFDKQIEKTHHKALTPKFTRTKNFVIKHYKAIFICFIILLVPSYICQSNTQVYYKLDESIPDNYGYSIATKTLKEDFNQVSQSIVLVDRNKKDYEINEMINEIEKIDGVNKVLSSSELSNLGITDKMINNNIKDIYETDKYKMILITSNYDIATNELNEQVNKIDKVIKKYDQNSILAGEGPLMKDLVEITDQDFKNVNFTSIGVIFVIMLIVLKSFSLPLLLVSAIEFAIFINMGIPYLTNTTLPFIASVVIGTIQLGATIDYAILLTTKYLDERKTNDKFKAVKIALDTSISSIFVSAMCFFAATIGVGLISKIDMIGSLCRLMSRGAIISMFVVILIVPSILLIFDKIIIKTTECFKKKGMNIMNNKNKKIAVLLIALLLPLSVNAATKNETVYQVIDANNNSETIVTDVLENIDGDVIDESDLENILNINGDEQYFKEGNKLRWKSNGNSIYYQGSTNKKLPIDISIKYYLDNKEINVKNLKGKSGHIKIKIEYTNNDKHDDLYTPFVVTMGTIIKSDNISHATISTGRIISNGKEIIVVGIAAPGLSDSLNMKDLDYLNELIIEYDTTSFSESDIYNVYSSNLLTNNDLKIFNKLDEIYGKVNQLSTSSTKIVNGAKDLNNGINEYSKKFDEYTVGVNKLNNGVSKAYDSYLQINGGIQQISSNENLEKLETLANVLGNLPETLNKANNVINKVKILFSDEQMAYLTTLSNNESNICNTFQNLNLNIDFTQEEIAALGLTDAQVQGISNGLTTKTAPLKNTLTKLGKKACTDNLILNGGTNPQTGSHVTGLIPTLTGMKNEIATLEGSLSSFANYDINTISKSVKSLETALKTISEYSNQFSNGLKEINNGSSTINSYTYKLNEATDKLDSGSTELTNGIKKFDNEGIQKIASYVNGDAKNIENKIKRLQELGKEYDTFTRKDSKMNGETKFIVKIEAN